MPGQGLAGVPALEYTAAAAQVPSGKGLGSVGMVQVYSGVTHITR